MNPTDPARKAALNFWREQEMHKDGVLESHIQSAIDESLAATKAELANYKQELHDRHAEWKQSAGQYHKANGELLAELSQLRDANAKLVAERDAAVKEAARRDAKWMAGIIEECKTTINFDPMHDSMTHTPTLGQFVADLRASLADSEAERGRLREDFSIAMAELTEATNARDRLAGELADLRAFLKSPPESLCKHRDSRENTEPTSER